MKLWVDYSNRRAWSYSAQVEALAEIASAVNVRIHPESVGLAVSTRLYLDRAHIEEDGLPRWQRTSASSFAYSERLGRDRLVAAVCWHGHYAFMSRLFDEYPNARIASAFDTWKGAEDFYARAEASGNRNIGSMYRPVHANEACLCCDRGDYILPRTSSGGMTTATIQQSIVRSCPHYIFSIDHYRGDGSCRCDDRQHIEMIEWGYVWNVDSNQWESPEDTDNV
jgi:hypothetical protein